MSFAYDIKQEICRNKPFWMRLKPQMAYGLMLFGKTFGPDSMSIHTEHKVLAYLYADLISDLVALRGSITVREVSRTRSRNIFVVTVDELCDRIQILSYFGYKAADDPLCIQEERITGQSFPAFLSGAFLVSGSITDPEKSYRLEFTTPVKKLHDQLMEYLETYIAQPKSTVRRNDYVLYYKESEPIEDLLTYMGASKHSLALMEVKMVKELRNKVNRETNCETANISKTINAAVTQMEDIRLIESEGGILQLPEQLREIARLRLDNPDLSLRELGQLADPPLSRSGINHRLRRISEYAEGIRTGKSNK